MKKKQDKKLLAFITTFFSILGFIIALIFWKDNKYVMFYAKQSIIVFIVLLIAGALDSILIIPIIGEIISTVVGLIALIFWIFSWVYALTGEMKEVPLIGQFARSLDI